jgi:hypothetical protein
MNDMIKSVVRNDRKEKHDKAMTNLRTDTIVKNTMDDMLDKVVLRNQRHENKDPIISQSMHDEIRKGMRKPTMITRSMKNRENIIQRNEDKTLVLQTLSDLHKEQESNKKLLKSEKDPQKRDILKNKLDIVKGEIEFLQDKIKMFF